MLTIIDKHLTKHKYIHIQGLLKKAFEPYALELPDIKLKLFKYSKILTGIYPTSKVIDFNLKQLLRLYKNKESIDRIEHNHFYRIKTFKQFLVFALYHEIEHYRQTVKHFLEGSFPLSKMELRADLVSIKVLNRLIKRNIV